jgi:hypothetical protein
MSDNYWRNADLENAYKVLTLELISITQSLAEADNESEKYYSQRSKQIAKELFKNSQEREKLRLKLTKEKRAEERREHSEEMKKFQLERKERLDIEASKNNRIVWTIEKF